MAISDKTIEQVKDITDILDVVSDFVNLKKVGQSYRGLSPFNQEKSPSFYVSPAKGIFKDFSSGKGGDAISFLMEHEGFSYIDAIRYLAQKYGIQIEETQTDGHQEAQNERESLYITLGFAGRYFQEQLWETDSGKAVGLSYFRERGFSDTIIKKFELGFTPDIWDGLITRATQEGYSMESLEKAGLILKREQKEGYYDRFRGRAIFPIHSISGKVIAFGARILRQDKKQPKYINSPETEVYHKSNVLYGIHLAKQAIRQHDKCILVEGYTDVISMHMSGIENVVASSGTSLTEGQIGLIKRYTENVTVLYDGDPAGIKASLRGVELILEKGLQVKIALLPDGEDPDSYARKHGSDGIQSFLEREETDFISFKAKLVLQETASDPSKKATAVREVITSIARIPDQIQRMVYIQEASRIFEIKEQILVNELNKLLLGNRKKKQHEQQEPEIEPSAGMQKLEERVKLDATEALYLQERECIRILLNYGDEETEKDYHLYDYMREQLEDIEFHHPVYSRIYHAFYQEVQKGNVPAFDLFLDIFNGEQEVISELVDLVTNKYELSANWTERWKIYVADEVNPVKNILRIKFRNIKRLIEYNLEDLKEAEQLGEPKKVDEILATHKELKKLEMELADALGNVIA